MSSVTIHMLEVLKNWGEHVKRFNLNINDVLDQTTGKVVLLGTHGIQNNETTKKVIRRWIELVNTPKYLNRTYSDMNFFVKALLQVEEEIGQEITRVTDWEIPRENNRFCDTLLLPHSPIWFAKAENKHTNPKYLA